jgi:hypothetical protein
VRGDLHSAPPHFCFYFSSSTWFFVLLWLFCFRLFFFFFFTLFCFRFILLVSFCFRLLFLFSVLLCGSFFRSGFFSYLFFRFWLFVFRLGWIQLWPNVGVWQLRWKLRRGVVGPRWWLLCVIGGVVLALI